MITIKVPCSSANIGPGFDVIGLALSIFLLLHVTVESWETGQSDLSDCILSYEGPGKEEVSLDPEVNLVTRVALYVLKCHNIHAFPKGTKIDVVNGIPLGRGLGSSGTAVAAGVCLGSVLGRLNLTKGRIFDHSLMIERHPDNVAASIFGGFVGTYLNELSPADTERKEIPLSEVLPEPAGGVDTGLKPPEPPLNIGHHTKFRWADEIKCIAIIPDFEVPTAKAREVLPSTYSRADMIFNMQRIALLTSALGQSPPDPDMIFEAMRDKVHQPYRQGLIPGLTEILQSVTPKSHPGLLGICLSGAGPTILALATDNFEAIADTIIQQFKANNITCTWRILSPAKEGTTVEYSEDELPPPGLSDQRLTYADAGVSIDAGNALVKRIKSAVATTKRPGADAEIGGFGGVIDMKAAGFDEPPLLVQAIDGIGTKLKIAFATGNFSTVGIDLVAMNVNDLLVQGAEPLTFLDYYACGKLDVEAAATFVDGVANACRQARCALVGGETAEMPSMYADGEFDAAGVATGAIHQGRKLLPDREAMVEGDVLLGLASSGPHSNGYSLIRKIVERQGLSFDEPAPWDQEITVGASLLTPTKIYMSCLSVARNDLVKGMAHITGGGLFENIPRMLPHHLAADLDAKAWPVPPALTWLKKAGNVDSAEFARVWNTGLGMVLVVSSDKVPEAQKTLEDAGETVCIVGTLLNRSGEGCVVRNMHVWD